MDVREFRHRVSDFFIDGTGDLSALDVRERDVHVRSCDGGRDCLVAVGDGDDDIGFEIVEDGREFRESDAGGLRHRCRGLSFEDHEDARVRLESVLLDVVRGVAVTVEEGGCRDDELEFEVGVFADCLERGFYPAVTRAGGDDDADFTHLISSQRALEGDRRFNRGFHGKNG